MRRVRFGFLVLGVLGFAARVVAQTPIVVNPAIAAVEFTSPDQTAVVPVGEANAGQQKIASYQAMVFPLAADVTTGVPVVIGPVIAKSLVATVGATTPPTFKLTFAQLGINAVGNGPNQIPPCVVVAPATCPAYDVLMVSLGPGGTSARAVAAESDPFTLVALQPTSSPAGPTNLKVKPQ